MSSTTATTSDVSLALHKDNDDPAAQAHVFANYTMRLAFYAGLTAILLMITALVIKLLWNFEEEDGGEEEGEERTTENSSLLSPKDKSGLNSYGATGQDLETGSITTSSSEDLYDGKLCVICYDDQRTCFFVPCGHCIACQTCSSRIMKEESKSCPICRGVIEKIRKIHVLWNNQTRHGNFDMIILDVWITLGPSSTNSYWLGTKRMFVHSKAYIICVFLVAYELGFGVRYSNFSSDSCTCWFT